MGVVLPDELAFVLDLIGVEWPNVDEDDYREMADALRSFAGETVQGPCFGTQAPAGAWQRISAGDGAKGPRVYDWAAAQLSAIDDFDGDQPTHQRWVLARRSPARPEEIAYYLAYAPNGTAVAELVRITGTRWAIEEAFQAAKNECGPDEYEVRRYPGWYRHITLAMPAHALLAAMASAAAERGAAETVPALSHRSPWRKSGDSWQLTVPRRHTSGAPATQ